MDPTYPIDHVRGSPILIVRHWIITMHATFFFFFFMSYPDTLPSVSTCHAFMAPSAPTSLKFSSLTNTTQRSFISSQEITPGFNSIQSFKHNQFLNNSRNTLFFWVSSKMWAKEMTSHNTMIIKRLIQSNWNFSNKTWKKKVIIILYKILNTFLNKILHGRVKC